MTTPPNLTTSAVLSTWWPLAASWLLMGIEIPMLNAAVARLGDAELNLAAFGGVVFPIALVVEAPIIMMLAASTALSRDSDSYRRLRRFMTQLSLLMTLVHVLVAWTPLFDVVSEHIIGAPDDVAERARIGLQIMTPWTWAIADRRFHQGLLIRFGRQRQVGLGTLLRLVGSGTPLVASVVLAKRGIEPFSGVEVAGIAVCSGVFMEAIYARICARSVINGPLLQETSRTPLTLPTIIAFYTPLAMTPLISLLAQPIGSAGITRMPESAVSLACWSALNGFIFMLRSIGIAFNEVVVRRAEDPGATRVLASFAWTAGGIMSLIQLVVCATPAATWWFSDLSGLDPELVDLARRSLWWAAPMPLLTFLHSWYQGRLVSAGKTRGVTESVAAFLIAVTLVLVLGVVFPIAPGATMAVIAHVIGAIAQGAWLWFRVRQLDRSDGAEIDRSAT